MQCLNLGTCYPLSIDEYVGIRGFGPMSGFVHESWQDHFWETWIIAVMCEITLEQMCMCFWIKDPGFEAWFVICTARLSVQKLHSISIDQFLDSAISTSSKNRICGLQGGDAELPKWITLTHVVHMHVCRTEDEVTHVLLIYCSCFRKWVKCKLINGRRVEAPPRGVRHPPCVKEQLRPWTSLMIIQWYGSRELFRTELESCVSHRDHRKKQT